MGPGVVRWCHLVLRLFQSSLFLIKVEVLQILQWFLNNQLSVRDALHVLQHEGSTESEILARSRHDKMKGKIHHLLCLLVAAIFDLALAFSASCLLARASA